MKLIHTSLFATFLLGSFSLACSDDAENSPTETNDSLANANSNADNNDSEVAASEETKANADENTADTADEVDSDTDATVDLGADSDSADETDSGVDSDSADETDSDDNDDASPMDPDISIATTDGGEALVNAGGFTLYYYASDTTDAEAIGVTGTWPAVKIETPSLGAGLDADDFGVTAKGSTTYKGLPLYTYANDTKPGDANGESSFWPLATP